MVDFINLDLGKTPHDPDFRKILNAALKDVGLSKEEQLGALFLVGYTACRSAAVDLAELKNCEKENKENLKSAILITKRLTLYASSERNFWGKLDPDWLHNKIYNLCYICHDVLAETDKALDDYFRSIKGGHVLLKSDIDEEWVSTYSDEAFKLGTVSNVYYDFIRKIGKYLIAEDISRPDSYSIGLATYGYMQQFDVKGNDHIAEYIGKFFSPMFSAIARYAELYLEAPYELSRNHVFSTIFWCHNGNIEEIVRAGIHKTHQMVFYEEGTCELRKFWNFEDQTNYEELISTSFRCAAYIRNNYINYEDVHISAVIKSGEVFDFAAIGADLDGEELWDLICGVMSEKYGFYVSEKGWQSTGEFMEFIGIFFYETCLHAIVANSVSIDEDEDEGIDEEDEEYEDDEEEEEEEYEDYEEEEEEEYEDDEEDLDEEDDADSDWEEWEDEELLVDDDDDDDDDDDEFSWAQIEDASNGDADALFALSNVKDAEEVKLYLKLMAAFKGHQESSYEVGLMFHSGKFNDVADFKEYQYHYACAYLQCAAVQGHEKSNYLLGKMYLDHASVDFKKRCVRWFFRAISFGYPEAAIDLADLYTRGHIVPKDYIEAYKWLNIAIAFDSSDDAIRKRDDVLTKKMTRRQIASAQEQTSEWLESYHEDEDA